MKIIEVIVKDKVNGDFIYQATEYKKINGKDAITWTKMDLNELREKLIFNENYEELHRLKSIPVVVFNNKEFENNDRFNSKLYFDYLIKRLK